MSWQQLGGGSVKSKGSENPLARWSGRSGPGVVDGGLATELERLGHDLSSSLWSAQLLADDPGAIESVHAGYLEAGADVIVTATYQATMQGFVAHGHGEQEARALLLRAVELACRARDRQKPTGLVAASIGPHAAFLADGSEYRGDSPVGVEELVAFHAPRWSILTASGADLLACETIPTWAEFEALCELQSRDPAKWAWFTFCCGDRRSLRDGAPLTDCLERLATVPRVAGVGANCVEPGHVLGIVELLRPATSLPILVYPNSGEVWDAGRRCWDGEPDPASFVEQARAWIDAGANLVGGCCRTGPEHIRGLRQSIG